ncbi:MAG: hypothetical protein ACKOHK_15695 [Planctomycetia bacterium]
MTTASCPSPATAQSTPCYADTAGYVSARIVANTRIADNTWRLRLDCPAIASAALPGQFAMLRIPGRSDPLLARPLAFYDTFSDETARRSDGPPHRYAEFIYAVHGRFTTALREVPAGHEMVIWGPLGNGFQIPAVDHLVLVAGGIGQTALLGLGRERLGQKAYGPAGRTAPPRAGRVTCCWGARHAGLFGGGQKTEAAAEAASAKDRRAALEQAIAANPATVEPYLELADILERDATVEEAQQILAKALAVSGSDLKVREHVEDRQLRWARNKLHVAEKRQAEQDSPENRAAVERTRAAVLKQEIEIYAARAARYPENLNWKYELAVRLKTAGNHAEAIKHFQDVLQDARRKGAVSLELGECFQKIRQYPLAMRSYQTAVESLTDREMDLRKRALYRAGVLAAGLDDPDSARKYLSTLAELDFGYRDVVQRLDKLTPAKDKGAGT